MPSPRPTPGAGDRGLAGTGPRRPGAARWYRAALFNELYFLVDGGTFWEAGEVGGPAPEPGDAGRFALLECIDYPFYDTVDVDFYASFAILELFPGLEAARDPRPAGRRPARRPGDRDDRGDRPAGRPQDRRGRCRTMSAGPRRPFYRPNWYRFQDVNVWKDLAPKFVLQVWRDAVHRRR